MPLTIYETIRLYIVPLELEGAKLLFCKVAV